MSNKHFFRHDCSARNDPKILALNRHMTRWRGYGLFMMTLELLSQLDNHKIPVEKIEVCAYDLHIKSAEYKKFLDICVEIGLLVFEDGMYYSIRFLKEMKYVDDQCQTNRDNAKRGWIKRKAEPEQTEIPIIEPKPKTDKKDKIDPKDIQSIFDYWNSKDIIIHQVFPDEMKHQVRRRISEYGVGLVKQAIDRYKVAVTEDQFWCKRSKEWTLTMFLEQHNAMPKFLTWELGKKTNNDKPSKVYHQAGKKYEGVD